MSLEDFPEPDDDINFVEEEEKILKLWQDINVVQKFSEHREETRTYSIYDGLHAASELPHYGNMLTGVIKDIVSRYAYQHGCNVERRHGWYCHKTRVEYEADRVLNIKTKSDITKMGVNKYITERSKVILKYSDEWDATMKRLGRWIDNKNENDVTFPTFRESVWCVFKQMFDKDLITKEHVVMSFSPGCGTTLSDYEAKRHNKEIVDPSIIVKLPLVDDENGTALLVSTTDPWSLVGNLACSVNPTLEYVVLIQISTYKRYIVAQSRADSIFEKDDYIVFQVCSGSDLQGMEYEPPFGYFRHLEDDAFRIVVDETVTDKTGTGIVPQAPYFNQHDYKIALNSGIITKTSEIVCPIDFNGKFTDPVTSYEGQYFKDANEAIIQDLKASRLLMHQTTVTHSRPFCWRCDTPLIQIAISTWHVRAKQMIDVMEKVSDDTKWAPNFAHHKFQTNWSKTVKNWPITKNNYWGTPVPLWTNGDEYVCVSSMAQLEELTGEKVPNMHRESLDDLRIPSKYPGNDDLRRVSEVFDYWFESCTIPFPQKYFPYIYKGRETGEYSPADFFVNDINHMKKWFLASLIISTAVFAKTPFKVMFTTGIISTKKDLDNSEIVSDPTAIIAKYGADAVRLYLIDSSALCGSTCEFREEKVRHMLRDIIIPWYNSFRFLLQNIKNYVEESYLPFQYCESLFTATNEMDEWILCLTQSTVAELRVHMDRFYLHEIVLTLTKYFKNLNNWYLHLNRKRLKGDGSRDDWENVLLLLFNVILTATRMMSPFAPFLSEKIYQELRELMIKKVDSVHYIMYPQINEALVNKNLERAVRRMQNVIELGRVIRKKKRISISYSLPEIIVIHNNDNFLKDILLLRQFMLEELNVANISTDTDTRTFGVSLRAIPDYRALSEKFKPKRLQAIVAGIQDLTHDEVMNTIIYGHKTIAKKSIMRREIKLLLRYDTCTMSDFEVYNEEDVLILLNVTPFRCSTKGQDEAITNEIIRRIEALRNRAQSISRGEISVFYEATDEVDRIATSYSQLIQHTTNIRFEPLFVQEENDVEILSEKDTLLGCDLLLIFTNHRDVIFPKCRWANLQLLDIESRFGNTSKATILLDGPEGRLGLNQLREEVFVLFGVEYFKLVKETGEAWTEEEIKLYTKFTIFVVPLNREVDIPQEETTFPFCRILNFTVGDVDGTIILENPVGVATIREEDYEAIINEWVDNSNRG